MKMTSLLKWWPGISLIAMLGTALLTGCTGVVYDEPRPVGYYEYDYYPAYNVYYYPRERVYYWNEGGQWRSGGQPPSHYVLREDQRQHLRFHTSRPWTEQQNPPPPSPHPYRGGGRDHDYDAR